MFSLLPLAFPSFLIPALIFLKAEKKVYIDALEKKKQIESPVAYYSVNNLKMAQFLNPLDTLYQTDRQKQKKLTLEQKHPQRYNGIVNYAKGHQIIEDIKFRKDLLRFILFYVQHYVWNDWQPKNDRELTEVANHCSASNVFFARVFIQVSKLKTSLHSFPIFAPQSTCLCLLPANQSCALSLRSAKI